MDIDFIWKYFDYNLILSVDPTLSCSDPATWQYLHIFISQEEAKHRQTCIVTIKVG